MNDEPQHDEGRSSFSIGMRITGLVMKLIGVVLVVSGSSFFLVLSRMQTDVSLRLNFQFLFILITLTGPLALLAVVSTLYSFVSWLLQLGRGG